MPPTDAFDDSEDLDPQPGAAGDVDLCALFTSLLRAELTGTRAGAVESTIAAAAEKDRLRLLLCLGDALQDDGLARWIEADAGRRARALAIATALTPADPAASHNAAVLARIRGFTDWGRFERSLIVVPGYTPSDAKAPTPGVHAVAQRRLQMAADDLRAGKAPFVLVSGGNVHPRGTPYYEAVEMKAALCALGVDEASILMDARARHTTTNLRNAGRTMRALGIASAVIVTKGGGAFGSDFFGQDFYLANPTLSTFHLRCERELGYRVGDLRAIDDGRIELTPSAAVDRLSFRDPLDP